MGNYWSRINQENRWILFVGRAPDSGCDGDHSRHKKITFTLGVFDNHSNIVTWYQFFNFSTLLSLPYCKLRWFGRKRSYVFLDWKTVKISFCLWFFQHVKIRLVPVNRTTFICHFRPNGPSHVKNRITVWFWLLRVSANDYFNPQISILEVKMG